MRIDFPWLSRTIVGTRFGLTVNLAVNLLRLGVNRVSPSMDKDHADMRVVLSELGLAK